MYCLILYYLSESIQASITKICTASLIMVQCCETSVYDTSLSVCVLYVLYLLISCICRIKCFSGPDVKSNISDPHLHLKMQKKKYIIPIQLMQHLNYILIF